MQKLENSLLSDSLIVNQTFSQTEYVIGKSDFAYVMRFH